jgi:hypothetical protein
MATDVGSLREVEATAAGDGQFRLASYPVESDSLQFRPGEIVECEIRTLANGSKGLVAFRSVSADSEFRTRRNIFAMTGALVGAILGAAIGFWFETSGVSMLIGLLVGAAVFSFCSARWGDAAWVMLSRVLRWM